MYEDVMFIIHAIAQKFTIIILYFNFFENPKLFHNILKSIIIIYRINIKELMNRYLNLNHKCPI